MVTEIDKIFIQVEGKRVEAKGQVLEQILKDRAAYEENQRLLKAESELKKQTLDSAIAKLAKLGLTEDEAKAIIGLQ